MLHLPILRHGVPYTSLDVIRVPHHRMREPFVEIVIQTNQISWDQPHEGNLFEHLYARRSFRQSADAVLAAADA
jgi:hypothetical protein